MSNPDSFDPIELEPPGEGDDAATATAAAADRRARMPEPLPVRLVAVADVRLTAGAGREGELDRLYAGVLGFAREGGPAAAVANPAPRRLVEPLLGGDRQGVTVPPVALGLRGDERAPAARLSSPKSSPLPPPLAGDAGPSDERRSTGGIVYVADNFRLIFDLKEGLIERESLRPLVVEVPSLAEAEAKLIEAEFEYARQRGLQAGQESLLLLDPGGNWLEITEMTNLSP